MVDLVADKSLTSSADASPSPPPSPQFSPRAPARDNRRDGSRPSTVCQYCSRPGHTAQTCWDLFPHLRPSRPSVNAVNSAPALSPSWIVDTGATHHVVSDLSHLSLSESYNGPDDVVLGDDSTHPITHTGSVSLSPRFSISHVLCVPSMSRNVISVPQFCAQNSAHIDFYPSYYVIKDLHTDQPLLTGHLVDNQYRWPKTNPPSVSPSVHTLTRVSPSTWHSRLGHPTAQLLSRLLASNPRRPAMVTLIHLPPSKLGLECSSCYCDMLNGSS